MEDTRLRRWLWWDQLSRIGFYVKEAYRFTAYPEAVNCESSGNTGQEVVRTKLGTLTWVPSDRRMVVSNTNPELARRLLLVFLPWDLQNDKIKYRRGKLPLQISSMLYAQGQAAASNPLFQ